VLPLRLGQRTARLLDAHTRRCFFPQGQGDGAILLGAFGLGQRRLGFVDHTQRRHRILSRLDDRPTQPFGAFGDASPLRDRPGQDLTRGRRRLIDPGKPARCRPCNRRLCQSRPRRSNSSDIS